MCPVGTLSGHKKGTTYPASWVFLLVHLVGLHRSFGACPQAPRREERARGTGGLRHLEGAWGLMGNTCSRPYSTQEPTVERMSDAKCPSVECRSASGVIAGMETVLLLAVSAARTQSRVILLTDSKLLMDRIIWSSWGFVNRKSLPVLRQ